MSPDIKYLKDKYGAEMDIVYYKNSFTLFFKLIWHSLRHPLTTTIFVREDKK